MAVDWEHGAWSKDGGEGIPDHRIIVAGDWAPIRGYEELLLEEPARAYGDLLRILRDADLRIVNLEVSLSEGGTPIAKDGKVLRGQPRGIGALAVVPFDVACLANNHIMDYGAEALDETVTALHARGIQAVGAGLSPDDAHRPLILALGDVRLGIVNFCEGEDGTTATGGPGVYGWEIGSVVEAICELRSSVDLVIVIAHAGREYAPAPPPYIQRTFRTIVRAGADVIVGHHPHVPQGVEIYKGVPIVYSLGNFLFHQDRIVSPFQRYGYLLSLELTDSTISGFGLVPYGLREGGVQQLVGVEREWLYRELRTVSELLDDPRRVRAVWDAFIDSFGEAFWRRECGGLAPLVALLAEDPRRAAAVVRNRFVAQAHRHLTADGLERLINGKLGASEDWARALVSRWKCAQDGSTQPS